MDALHCHCPGIILGKAFGDFFEVWKMKEEVDGLEKGWQGWCLCGMRIKPWLLWIDRPF
jgi:hypothetical protein